MESDFWANFLDKLGKARSASEGSAKEKYGAEYESAGKLGKAAMRGLSSGAFDMSGTDGAQQDLNSFVSLRPLQMQSQDPLAMYSRLYNAYGGRKVPGLLFD